VLIAGRYRLQDAIGRGAMGEVWRAYDDTLGRPVAVKLLLPQDSDTTAASRFRLEAQTAGRLHHPHVVGVLDFGTYENKLFLVMELVEGDSLAGLLARSGPQPAERVARIAAEAAAGLAAAHQQGIVHRDIKPANLLLDADGTLKIGYLLPQTGDLSVLGPPMIKGVEMAIRDLNAAVLRMATLAAGGRITREVVDEEITRLREQWQPAGARRDSRAGTVDLVAEILGEDLAGELDRFDRVQLADVLSVCRTARTLSDAGRVLFAHSRAQKKSINDADRLKKYLARFGLTWADVSGRGATEAA